MSFKLLWSFSAIPIFWMLYQFHSTSLTVLSPQGCRMSWMSPSYVVQDEFNTTWTHLARRYSLLLYREVGWDTQAASGRPALFIPGNAGSSHQVRSIASSAARQIYSSPLVRSTDLASNVEPLDLYAVEFNEDLSALHGPTLQTQTEYVKSALEYIVSRYPHKRDLQVILLGHSMGGIVALNALASEQHKAIVSGVITMSSPHSLPPARLDRDIEQVFRTSVDVLRNSPNLNHSSEYTPPVLALCGGATDNMLPMESCALPPTRSSISPKGVELYRRTVFTSGLDGTWTGVGHREMVWCHQVRWRVARASLELAVARPDGRGTILDRWFAGIPNQDLLREPAALSSGTIAVEVSELGLTLNRLPTRTTTYHFSRSSSRHRLVIMLSRGRISGVAPEKEVVSDVFIDVCQRDGVQEMICTPAVPKSVRLVPNPSPHENFPVPGEGTDESEGVVVWESKPGDVHGQFFAITVKSTKGEGSWLVASIEPMDSPSKTTYNLSKLVPFFGTELTIPSNGRLIQKLWIPNLISNAIVVYKAKFIHEGNCNGPLLAPLLVHTSSSAESHFHRATGSTDGALLHSHNAGPFLGLRNGLHLTVLSSGECHVTKIQFTVDWKSSIGRSASRLWSGVFACAVALAAAMNAQAWYNWNGSKHFPSLCQSFEDTVLRFGILGSCVVVLLSAIPFLSSFVLGLGPEPLFIALGPISIWLAAASVGCSCYLLDTIQWALGQLSRTPATFGVSINTETRRHSFTKSSIIFYTLLAGLVIVLIPYQVAYVVAFLLHLWGCSVLRMQLRRQARDINLVSSYGQASHLLLLLFWLLPLVAPVLIVWARTLINAGITTPFDGDHNVLDIVPIVMCVELGGSQPLSKSSGWYRNTLTLSYLLFSLGAVVFGARYTYLLYSFFKVCCCLLATGVVLNTRAVQNVSH